MNKRNINKKGRNPWETINAEFPKDKNGIIYVRQSSLVQMQKNVHSYEMQTEKFLEHFRNMGCTGYIEIIADDEAMSGTLDIHQRPGMTRALDLIKREELLHGEPIGWVAAVAVNRFTRDRWLITPGVLMKTCYENDVWIATLRMHFNFQDEYCRRVFMMEAEEAARHLEWMKLILGGARSTASDNGYYDGRYIVPGYIVDRTDIDRKHYVIYPPHATVVQWLFQRFFELDGNFPQLFREVEQWEYVFPKFESWVDAKTLTKFSLNGNKIKTNTRTPEGHYKVFRHGLESILTNPVYIGWWIPLDGGVIKGNHEPIVDEVLFAYAHKRLSTHTLEGERQHPERVTRHPAVNALLQNVLQDADGTPIYAARAGKFYRCRERKGRMVGQDRFVTSIDETDGIFLEKFFERLQSWKGCEEWEDTYLEQKAEKAKVRQKQEQLIKRQIKEAGEKMQEIQGTISTPGCPKSLKEKLFVDYERLEKKKTELEGELIPDPTAEEDDEELLFQIHTLLPKIMDMWDAIPFQKRVRFVGALVDKVLLSFVAPSWLRMEIRWKRTDWESDVAYIRRRANGDRWTEEEENQLRAFYAHAEALDLLRAIPQRSYRAIKLRALELGLRRENMNRRYLPENGLDEGLCEEDRVYMQAHGLVLSTKNVQWSPLP